MTIQEEIDMWIYGLTMGYCFYCGNRLAFHNRRAGQRAAWQGDHFVPFSRNGANQLWNMVPACVKCNTKKADLMPWEYEPDRFTFGDRNPWNYL